jgi:hypothetical protein
VLPDTSALRLVLGASYLYNRDTSTFDDFVKNDPNCVDGRSQQCARSFQPTTTVDKLTWTSLGAGIGFEFGAIMTPGFSAALDLTLTAIFDRNGLFAIWPLPQLALMYSW